MELFLLREVIEGVVSDPKLLVSEKVGDLIFHFKAGEFFQNNPYILPQLVEYVVTQANAEENSLLSMPIVVVDFLALVRHPVLRKSWVLKSVGKVLRVPVPMPRSTGSKMPSFSGRCQFYFSGNSYRYRISRIGRGSTPARMRSGIS